MNIKKQTSNKKTTSKKVKVEKKITEISENNVSSNVLDQAIIKIEEIGKEIQKKIKEKDKLILKIFEVKGTKRLRKKEKDFLREILEKNIVTDEYLENTSFKTNKGKKENFAMEDINNKMKNFLKKFKTSGKLETLEKELLNHEMLKENLEIEKNKIEKNDSKQKRTFRNLQKEYRKLNYEIKEKLEEILYVLNETKKHIK